jgi:hypothetical protein
MITACKSWEGPPDSSGHASWGLRHGHRTESELKKKLWVPGACELEAMRAARTTAAG